MELTSREIWTAVHGMVLGAGFLLAFSGGFAGLWGLRSGWLTAEGAKRLLRSLAIGSWGMAILAWLAVLLGTYVIYPWYRAKAPLDAGVNLLAGFPKYLLLSKPQTSQWHEFGMEWKEHIAWFCPILATAVAFVAARYGRQLIHDAKLRRALLILFSVSFFCAAVAGAFGALINKAAPTR
jgi:hypothetical protein